LSINLRLWSSQGIAVWKFLKYEDENIYIDLQEYHIKDVGKIMGILSTMVSEKY